VVSAVAMGTLPSTSKFLSPSHDVPSAPAHGAASMGPSMVSTQVSTASGNAGATGVDLTSGEVLMQQLRITPDRTLTPPPPQGAVVGSAAGVGR